MIIAGHPYSVMTQAEVDLIYRSALSILQEMGMQVQNERLLKILAERGLPVDFLSKRVRFPVRRVEEFIAGAPKFDWENVVPSVMASAGVYHSLYHDPESGRLIPWDEDSLAFYFALARELPHIGRASLLGSRLPTSVEPLDERFLCWKYGAGEGGSIYLDEMCPFLEELYQARAEEQGQAAEKIFHATVFLIPALKLGRHEAYQVMYFHERGLKVGIGGSMLTMGATAPVTLAGAVALNLAEQLALGMLNWVLWEENHLHIFTSIGAMDMRTTIRPFGRPEMTIAILMTAQIARWLGAAFSGHAGLTDAKLPSGEASAQKAISAIPTLLAGGSLGMDAGLLAMDEICSPVQLALDGELLSALKHFINIFQVSPESIGLEMILEAGPGGQYLNREHTAKHFRNEIWEPTLWSRRMLQAWRSEGCPLDVDKARAQVLDVKSGWKKTSLISEEFEKTLRGIIERAKKALS